MRPVLTTPSWVSAKPHSVGSQMAMLTSSSSSLNPLLSTPSAPLILLEFFFFFVDMMVAEK